jgi:uncharacterized protein YndB with AHSA1/START domain
MTNTGNLEVTLPNDREIMVTRVFDAPRTLVWEAMSEPELIKRWLSGPPGWTMTRCDNDSRVGGEFHWAWRGPDGSELSMHGVNREIVPHEKVVRTELFTFGDAPGGEQLATLILKEESGKTHMTISLQYPSKEPRDMALKSGVDKGMEAGYERLDQLLKSQT